MDLVFAETARVCAGTPAVLQPPLWIGRTGG